MTSPPTRPGPADLTPLTPARAQGFVDHIDDIKCPRCSEPFERSRLLDTGEWGYVRCERRRSAGVDPCGCKVLVMFFVRRSETRTDVKRAERPIRAYVAEVDWREVEYFEQSGMDVDAILLHLQRYPVAGASHRFRRR